MARALAILQSEYPYNISARCINRDWFKLPLDQVWEIYCLELSNTIERHNLRVHSFVLMSNHFHLIASTPNANISDCMQMFMTRTSKALTYNGNRINETYAGRHHKCILNFPNYFLNAYKYVYRNPVSAGLSDKVENYPYSSIHFVRGTQSEKFRMAEDTTFLTDPQGTLNWLNEAPNFEKLEALKFGLKRQFFTSKKNRKDNKPVLTKFDLI